MSGGIPSPFRFRLVRFVAVGLGANMLLLGLAYLFRRAGMPAFAAGIAGYSIAFAAAYLLQRDWTFGASHRHSRVFPRYLLAQLGCAVVSGLVGHICVTAFGASPFWMSVAVTAVAGTTSYLLSSFWVFAGDAAADKKI